MRLIDADEMSRRFAHYGDGAHCYDANDLDDMLAEMPTIEAEPVKHGGWIALDAVFLLIAGHSDYHGDDILSTFTCLAEGKEVNPVVPINVSKAEPVKHGTWWHYCQRGRPFCSAKHNRTDIPRSIRKGENMTKDISVAKLIKCAEIHFDVDEECGGCDYKGCDIACVDALLADAITIIKAGYREACKVENGPIDEEKGAGPISVLTPIKSPSEGAFEVLWTEGGEGQKLRFTDMENATIFTDLLLNAKRNVGEVTIRRTAW